MAWFLAQVLVLRPAIGAQEHARALQTLEAARQMRSGADKRDLEESWGVDLRILVGPEAGPPPGEGWVRLEHPDAVLWKRDGGKYDIAAWTGQVWVVLHEDLPVTSTLALAFGAFALPLVAAAFVFIRREQRHQEQAEAALARVAGGDLTERLDEYAGSREVRRLARAVNGMSTELQALLDRERQRAAALSHELRTPLTRIRLQLELARREGASAPRLDAVERDIEHFDVMLTEMLEISRLQMVGRHQLSREVVDLEGLARMVVDEEAIVDVEISGGGTAMVDSALVARMLRNLLRNSVQHAPAASRWIRIADRLLEVGDDGPGIPDTSVVLAAFRRGADSTGHGLGLTIVAQIAAVHGAELSLSDPPGLVVQIRFKG